MATGSGTMPASCQAARVRTAWQEAGIVPLPVAIAPEGVTSG